MSKKLPFVGSDIPRDLRAFLDRVRELVGGSGADRLVTADELTAAGLAGVDGRGNLTAPAQPFLATPPSPTNVAATAAIRNIIVSWEGTAYSGHAYAEVWVSSTDNLGEAVLLGMSPGTLFVHGVGPSSTRYYWVRFVNQNDVKGPYNGTAGTDATTGPDVDYMLGVLAGSITESELATDLNDRIDLIDGPAETPGTIANQFAFVQGQIDAINSYPDYDNGTTYAADDIVKYDGGLYKALGATTGNLPTNTTYWLKIGDYSSLADVVAAHTAEIAVLTSDLGGEVTARETLATQLRGSYTGTDLASVSAGLIYSERTARSTADSGLAASITTVAATAAGKNKIYRQATEPTSPQLNDIWVDTRPSYAVPYFSEDYATARHKQFQWDGAGWLDITDTDITDNFALVTREQLARADADSALAQDILTLNTKVDTDIGVVTADLQIEREARIEEDAATVELIETLDAQVNNAITGLPSTRATLLNDYSTTATVNSAIASSKTALRAYADVGSKSFRQNDAPTKRGMDADTTLDIPLQAGDLWVDTNDQNKLYQWSGSAWVYSPDAAITGAIGAVDSRVTTVETTQIGYCTIDGLATDDTNKGDCEAAGGTWTVGVPMATAVKQVAVTDANGSTAAIEQAFTAQKTLNDGFKLQYSIKLDNDGYVSGFGLYNTGSSSEFIVNTDRFAVTTPSTSIPLRTNNTPYSVGQIARISGQDSKTLVCKTAGTSGSSTPSMDAIGTMLADGTVVWQVASRVPFAVQATPQTINGQAVPAGVYIDAAYVLSATIQNAQIADLAVDDQKIASINVGKLTAGSIGVGEYIQSTNFISGTQGWRISGNGNGEFSNVTVRGTVYATDGQFVGKLLGGAATSFTSGVGLFSGVESGAYKFRIGSPTGDRVSWDGANLTVSSPQFTLSDGSATFGGTIDVKSAASGARMEIKNDVIKVFDSSGVLRIQIGDLAA